MIVQIGNTEYQPLVFEYLFGLRTRALIQSLQSRGIPGKEVDYL